MSRNKTWNSIANGFYAADKIKTLISAPENYSRSSSVWESNITTIIEVLRVISQYSPETHRQFLSAVVEKGDLYGNTYRNLKHHIQAHTGTRGDMDSITTALSILRPVVSNRPGITIEKILKIYEIIKS